MRRELGLTGLVAAITAFLVALGLILVERAQGATWRELLQEEKAAEGASHVLTVFWADLTNTTVGATQAVKTASVGTNTGAWLVSAKLITPFADTNLPVANTSLWVRVGDDTAPAQFLAQTSLSAANAPTWLSLGTGSNKTYASADTLDARFHCTATNALSELDRGEARFYFRIITRP